MDLSGCQMTNINGMINVLLTSLKHNVTELIYNICYVWNWIDQFNDIDFKHKVKMLTMSYNVYIVNGDEKYHVYDTLMQKFMTTMNTNDPYYKLVIKTIPDRHHKLCSVINMDFDMTYNYEQYIIHGSIIENMGNIMIVTQKPFGFDLIEPHSMMSVCGEKKFIPARISKYISEPWSYYRNILHTKIVDMIELNPINVEHLKFINKYTMFQPNKKYMIDDDLLYRCNPMTITVIDFYKYD